MPLKEDRIVRKLAAFVLAASLLALGSPVSANIVTVPYVFAPNTLATAEQVNADFSSVYTLVNGYLDATNLQYGPGIYANEIVPTNSGNATFGGSQVYTFPSGVTANGNVTATNGYLSTSQGANTGSIFFGSSGTNKLDYGVTTAGTFTFSGPVNFSGAIGGTIYASTIVPTTTAQGTFGGSVAFTFPAGTYVNGNSVVTGGYLWDTQTGNTGMVVFGNAGSANLNFGDTTSGTFTMNYPLNVPSIAATSMTLVSGSSFSGALPVWVGGSNAPLSKAHEEYLRVTGGAGTYSFSAGGFDSTPICTSTIVTAVTTTTYTVSGNGSFSCAGL